MGDPSSPVVSLSFHQTDRGFSQRFLSPSGAEMLAAGPHGDLVLDLGGGGAKEAAYTSTAGDSALLERADLSVETSFTPAPDARGFDVSSRLTALAPVSVISFGHVYVFPPGAGRAAGAPLDYAWLPTLKSAPGDVAGDHVFRSPCIITRQGGAQAALVPHLGSLGSGPLRSALDLSLPRGGRGAGPVPAPSLAYLLCDWKPHGHVYFAPTGAPAALRPGDTLEIGFTLLFDTEAGPLSFQRVLRFLWKRYGEANLDSSVAPQALPFGDYARRAFHSIFDLHGMWRGFRLGGAEAGGLCAQIYRPGLAAGGARLPKDPTLGIAVNYLVTRSLGARQKADLIRWKSRSIHPHIWNAVFFNNVRTAFGIMHYARLWVDSTLEGRARAIWNLALAAPSRSGIFPSVFAGDERHPHWVPGTKVWRYTRSYHTPDAAVTGWWMLAAERHLGAGGIFRERCAGLGDFFLRAQLPSGAIPTWVRVGRDGSLSPEPVLAESAGSAAAGLFLASLAEATGRQEYRDAARGVADFIIRDVFPRQAWQDTEVFFSCSAKPLDWRDASTGILPQGTLCLGWTAELLGALHRQTGEQRFLDHGRAAVDLLLLYQQIWNAPFLGMDTRGGFGVMNTDAEWSDARQALYGPLLMDWYGITGEAELFHRGVAALRAAFTLMYLEEHRGVAPVNTGPLTPADRGAVAENYGHAGTDAKIMGYVMPDWGAGTAVSAVALAELRWGDLYVDAARGAAFGVNGCRVLRADLTTGSFAVELEKLPAAPATLKCSGLAAPRLEVIINGARRGNFSRAELEKGVRL